MNTREKITFHHGAVTDFVQWYDTDGNIINASDGGIICVDGVYHWYGMALRPLPARGNGLGGQQTTTGVVMYASTDLQCWTYEGVILACSEDPESALYAPMRFERPKIIRCPKTGEYVLWCHYVCYPGDHGDTPGTSEAGLAVCDTVNGTYRWLGTTRPIDQQGLVRDSTLYQDRDGQAYFIYDRMVGEDRCLHIVRLQDDYRSFTDAWKRLDVAFWREAAVITWHDGWYFMVTSGLTSWQFNQARYYRARSLMGDWEDMGDPCVDDLDHQTFHAQGTYAFRVEGKNIDVMMLERHNTSNFVQCSYIWLPILYPENGKLELRYSHTVEI